MLAKRIDSRSSSVLPHRVSIPNRLIKGEIGAGTLVRRCTTRLGLRTCAGCQDRADALNSRLVFVGAGNPPAPKPGCWFAGTSCYGFIQPLKFCSGYGTEYTERYGWCIGFWLAPPSRPQGGSVVAATKETSDVAEDVLDLDDLQITGKNISVQGRVVDATDLLISGLVVIATGIDTVTKDDVLGRAVTNGDGAWSLSYPPSVYQEALGDRPDIVVTVLFGDSDTRGDSRRARVTFLVGA
jgi:hypothetical protein